jgi:hypothetical protein
MMPTVLIGVLIIIRILVYGLATDMALSAFFFPASQSQSGLKLCKTGAPNSCSARAKFLQNKAGRETGAPGTAGIAA